MLRRLLFYELLFRKVLKAVESNEKIIIIDFFLQRIAKWVKTKILNYKSVIFGCIFSSS